MFNLATKKYGKIDTYLYLRRAEISALVMPMGSVCPFSATK